MAIHHGEKETHIKIQESHFFLRHPVWRCRISQLVPDGCLGAYECPAGGAVVGVVLAVGHQEGHPRTQPVPGQGKLELRASRVESTSTLGSFKGKGTHFGLKGFRFQFFWVPPVNW